jgi:hypothetical protein
MYKSLHLQEVHLTFHHHNLVHDEKELIFFTLNFEAISIAIEDEECPHEIFSITDS